MFSWSVIIRKQFKDFFFSNGSLYDITIKYESSWIIYKDRYSSTIIVI